MTAATDLPDDLLERLGCGVVVAGGNGTLVCCNRPARDMAGLPLTPHALDGYAQALVGEGEAKALLAWLRTAGNGDGLTVAASERRWFHLTVARAEGRLVLTVADVTAFKRREVLLTELHERLAGEGRDLKRFAQDLAVARSAAAEALRRSEHANAALEREVGERRLLETELRRLADTDPLTEALNRRRFLTLAEKQAQRAAGHGWPLALLMLDLDHFKGINDRFGHDAGDRALHHFAAVVRGTLRAPALFGRLGGEEFAVLLPDCDLESATRVADRLRRLVKEQPPHADAEGGRMALSVSIGAAVLTPPEATAERLLKRADEALYAAKRAGRDRVAAVEG
ncbi:MAG: GGDEF domain-containing protein [Geminicoccaceae bacterium]|nr:GGDEF domain-containing protein [Geminicoccaceae bacterium]